VAGVGASSFFSSTTGAAAATTGTVAVDAAGTAAGAAFGAALPEKSGRATRKTSKDMAMKVRIKPAPAIQVVKLAAPRLPRLATDPLVWLFGVTLRTALVG
jgi:hypothetical protein